jgi:hypothetical protein
VGPTGLDLHFTPRSILKSTEPYRVLSHLKALNECFPDQLNVDAVTSFDDATTKTLIFTQKFNLFVFHLKIIIIGIYVSTRSLVTITPKTKVNDQGKNCAKNLI